MKVQLGPLALELPEGWVDITREVEGENPPWSVAHEDGTGALQFSVALYVGGTIPNPTPDQLVEMVRRFGVAQGWDAAREVDTQSDRLRIAAASFRTADAFVRVWQVSDGRNFAFVTYTCQVKGGEERELPVCEGIVRSIEFLEG